MARAYRHTFFFRKSNVTGAQQSAIWLSTRRCNLIFREFLGTSTLSTNALRRDSATDWMLTCRTTAVPRTSEFKLDGNASVSMGPTSKAVLCWTVGPVVVPANRIEHFITLGTFFSYKSKQRTSGEKAGKTTFCHLSTWPLIQQRILTWAFGPFCPEGRTTDAAHLPCEHSRKLGAWAIPANCRRSQKLVKICVRKGNRVASLDPCEILSAGR